MDGEEYDRWRTGLPSVALVISGAVLTVLILEGARRRLLPRRSLAAIAAIGSCLAFSILAGHAIAI